MYICIYVNIPADAGAVSLRLKLMNQVGNVAIKYTCDQCRNFSTAISLWDLHFPAQILPGSWLKESDHEACLRQSTHLLEVRALAALAAKQKQAESGFWTFSCKQLRSTQASNSTVLGKNFNALSDLNSFLELQALTLFPTTPGLVSPVLELLRKHLVNEHWTRLIKLNAYPSILVYSRPDSRTYRVHFSATVLPPSESYGRPKSLRLLMRVAREECVSDTAKILVTPLRLP